MPTLDWIGKKSVVNHHREVPYRLLHCDKAKSVGDPDAGNLLVQGDNLEALKALLPYYAGKVKCIYIDPPYNTGNESWVYNDNVNSPEIKAWLGGVVGKEAEDLSRHDKWLCMMYPRLRLLKEFLSIDGAVFVSIDDVEFQSLRFLMDDIFGKSNFIATICWQKIYTVKNSAKHLSGMHDYLAVYSRSKSNWSRNLRPRDGDTDEDYTNPDSDDRGEWISHALQSRNFYSKGTYAVECPGGRKIAGPPEGTYWRVAEKKLWNLHDEGRVWWGKDGNNAPRIKEFLSEAKEGVVPTTWWTYKFAGTNSGAKTMLREILGSDSFFNTPKPVELISRILELASDKDSLILDAFAGSATTGHAVLAANQADGGKRMFILAEMDSAVAKDVAAVRLSRVVEGYEKKTKNGSEAVSGIGGGFRYCILGEPLFDAAGSVNPSVTFPDFASHVFFCETGSPIPRKVDGSSSLIGMFQGRAVYLLFDAQAMGVPTANAGNILTASILENLPPPSSEFTGPRVVYAEGCTVPDERLAVHGVTFKQVPYQIEGL